MTAGAMGSQVVSNPNPFPARSPLAPGMTWWSISTRVRPSSQRRDRRALPGEVTECYLRVPISAPGAMADSGIPVPA